MTLLRLVLALWLAAPITCAAGVNGFSTTGPYGGWTVLAAHPSASGHALAARSGTIFRTTNAGRSWERTNGSYAGGIVRAIAFDPGNSDGVYAAVGSTLYLSGDGGASWSKSGSLPLHYFFYAGDISLVSRLAVSPHTPGDVYIADGVLSYSADSGKTFTAIGPPQAYLYDFLLDPAMRGAVYAATHDSGFARSSDNGATWITGEGLPDDYAGIRLAAAGDRLYLVLARRDSAPIARYVHDRYVVYASSDHGAHWQAAGLAIEGPLPWKEIDVVGVPLHPDNILLRTGAALKVSRDAGATWSNLALPDDGVAQAIAADASHLYAAVLGYGVRRSGDGGTTWDRARGGLPPVATNHVATMDTTFLATTPDVYIPRPAELLRRTTVSNAWATSLLSPSASISLFSDRGGHFLGVRNGPYAFRGFVTIPGTSTVMAYGDGGQVLESNDRGANWTRIDAEAPGNADRFAVANDAATIYACGNGRPTSGGHTWGDGVLARSGDRGRTWTNLTARPGRNFGCSAITVAAGSSDTAYLAITPEVGQGVVYTQDGGSTWTLVPGTDADIVVALASAPADPHRVIAARHYPPSVLAIDVDTGARDAIGDLLPAPPRSLALDLFSLPPMLYVGTSDGVFTRPAVAGPGPWTMLAGSKGLVVDELTLTWPPQTPTRRTLAAATSAGIQEFTLDPTSTLVPVYRLFNTQAQSHLFTASAEERNDILATLPYFADEGVAFYGLLHASPLAIPVHRFYQPARNAHAYALTETERAAIAASGDAVYEGVAYYVPAPIVQEPGTLAGYRFVNATTGGELFTTDDDERDDIRRGLPQFTYRGVAFTAYPTAR